MNAQPTPDIAPLLNDPMAPVDPNHGTQAHEGKTRLWWQQRLANAIERDTVMVHYSGIAALGRLLADYLDDKLDGFPEAVRSGTVIQAVDAMTDLADLVMQRAQDCAD